MRRLFVLLYDDALGTRQELQMAINATAPIVLEWRFDLPNSFFLISEATAKTIAEAIRFRRPNGRFVVLEAGGDYWGWDHPETWHMFQNKAILETPAPTNQIPT